MIKKFNLLIEDTLNFITGFYIFEIALKLLRYSKK